MILIHFINWIIRRLGIPTLFSWLLLLIGLGSVAWALAEVVRGLSLGLLLAVAIGGLLLGWILAVIRVLPAWLAGSIIFILGIEAFVLWIGGLRHPVASAGQRLVNLAWQLWSAPLNSGPLVTSTGLALNELGANLNTLSIRFLNWFVTLFQDAPTFDPVVTPLLWCLALWIVSAWAAWGVRRLERPLLAMSPAAALLVITLAHTLKYVDSLLPLLAATLLLIGSIEHYRREHRWQINRIDFPTGIRTELAIAIVAISLGLVVIASAMPLISIKAISRLVKSSTQTEAVIDTLGLQSAQNQQPAALSRYRAPGLPRRHLLGSGPELSEQVALIISTDEINPVTPAQVDTPPAAPRRYWRSTTYDIYNGKGWRTSATEQTEYGAGEIAPDTNPTGGRQLLRQTVQVVNNQSDLLYAAGDIVTADQLYRINWRGPKDSFAATIDASNYQVDSLISTASEADLRSPNPNYPDWVQKRYLRLPESVPARVWGLARDLTATAATPYDRARAIEAYLRTYPYNLDLPEPPANQDMVDYFLFDLKEGYCDYYATSMVVLARAAGLPARLAVGYASGAYDPQNGQYIVTEANAHSWVEVYFPEYGWVEFEPTAAQPVDSRTNQPNQAELIEPSSSVASTAGWRNLGRPAWGLIGGVLLFILLATGYFGATTVDGWRLRRLSSAVAVTRLYQRLQQQGQRLVGPATGETPYEFATILTTQLEAIAQSRRWQSILAPATQEVHRLTSLYVKSSYSAHPPDSIDQQQAIQTWQRLNRRLWLARLYSAMRR